MRRIPSTLRTIALGALALTALLLPVACSHGDTVPLEPIGDGEGDKKHPQGDEDAICLLHNCNADDECGACSDGRTTCLVSEHRCVACDSGSGTGCPDGQQCSSWGKCVPQGLECPTDNHGNPTISCGSSADCAACDPMHLVCDTAAGKCVACTASDTSECQQTDICVDGQCAGKCPSTCDADADCGQCGSAGHEAHACHAHKCAECSATHACPAGEECSPQGTCIKECGQNNSGACQSDADCNGCGGTTNVCHTPINGGDGTCGPAASGCSDLGEGTIVLPDPFGKVTNTCSNDADCSGVGIQLNVGKMLRDLTGVDQIDDANIDYGMNVCADVTIGSGNNSISCGICVPCQVDSDCDAIDIDQVALDAFGPIGSLAAALLLDQVFGQNDHKIHMYCEQVAAGYGVCSPCPGFIYECGVDGGGGGGTGTCDHEECDKGGPLNGTCSQCTSDVCAYDEYCCNTAWDAQCVAEAEDTCGLTCSGGGADGCAHDECSAGAQLDQGCSTCAADVCAADPYCCSTAWDDQCVSEVDQYCAQSCGGGGGSCHDECTAGAGMDPSCSQCAAELCAADSYCCDTAWDAQCVTEVDQYCSSVSCGGGGPTCDHPECSAGVALDPACSSCAGDVCSQDPFCCDTQWDQQCADEASQICGC